MAHGFYYWTSRLLFAFTNTNFEEKSETWVFLLDKSLLFRFYPYKFIQKLWTRYPNPSLKKLYVGFVIGQPTFPLGLLIQTQYHNPFSITHFLCPLCACFCPMTFVWWVRSSNFLYGTSSDFERFSLLSQFSSRCLSQQQGCGAYAFAFSHCLRSFLLLRLSPSALSHPGQAIIYRKAILHMAAKFQYNTGPNTDNPEKLQLFQIQYRLGILEEIF